MSFYKKSAIENKVRESSSAILAILCLYLIMEAVGITCPIRFLTGISCAGCGMSRAFLSVLHLDFEKAFYYHPLFGMVIPVGLCIVFRQNIKPRLFKLIVFMAALLFLIVYIIRLIYIDQTIVVFQPEEGFIYQIIQSLIY